VNGAAVRRGAPHRIDDGLQFQEAGIAQTAIPTHPLQEHRRAPKRRLLVMRMDEGAHYVRQDEIRKK